jgi:hypothetical protein
LDQMYILIKNPVIIAHPDHNNCMLSQICQLSSLTSVKIMQPPYA